MRKDYLYILILTFVLMYSNTLTASWSFRINSLTISNISPSGSDKITITANISNNSTGTGTEYGTVKVSIGIKKPSGEIIYLTVSTLYDIPRGGNKNVAFDYTVPSVSGKY